jgi:hypothetical protein
MSMILQCKESSRPHPEGIHPAVCVDVVDLGLTEVEFQGQRKMVNKVKVVFETEAKWEDGKNCTVSKNFTASLHQKAKLADFLKGSVRQLTICSWDQESHRVNLLFISLIMTLRLDSTNRTAWLTRVS